MTWIGFSHLIVKCQKSKQACNHLQIQWSQVTAMIKGVSNFCISWRKEESTAYTKKTSQSPLIFCRVIWKFRPTRTLTEEGRHTNSLPYCSDDVLSVKLWFEARNSELWWIPVIATKGTLLSLWNKTPGLKTRLQLLSQDRAWSSAWGELHDFTHKRDKGWGIRLGEDTLVLRSEVQSPLALYQIKPPSFLL